MSRVTEEECRMLEEIFIPKNVEDGKPSMTGISFILLYDAIRKRVQNLPTVTSTKQEEHPRMDGVRFLWHFCGQNQQNKMEERTIKTDNDTELSHRNICSRKENRGMDGVKFLGKYFSKNSAIEKRNKTSNFTPIFRSQTVSNLLERAKTKEGSSNHYKTSFSNKPETGMRMDGLKFLWNFFSTSLPDHLDTNLKRRYEEVRSSCNSVRPQDNLPHNKLMKKSRKHDPDSQTSELSSTCSTISFVSVDSSRSPIPERSRKHGSEINATSSSVHLLGPLDAQEEYYLETPSTSSNEDSDFDDSFIKNLDTNDANGSVSWEKAYKYFDSLRNRLTDYEEVKSNFSDDSFEHLNFEK